MKKILLVEDDQIDQLAFKRTFKKRFPNDTCIVADSIKAALKLYQTASFDFLVIDYNLSDGNAFDFFSSQVNTPTIILSGMINPELVQNAKKKGAIDFLAKDTRLDYLPLVMDMIQQYLDDSYTITNVSPSATPADNQTFDLHFLNKTFDEDKAEIKEVLQIFLKYNAIDLKALKEGLKEQNSQMVQDKAHKIKSGYRLLGISLATELTEQIEEEAKEIDQNLLPLQEKVDNLTRLSKETNRLIEQLLKSNYFDQD